MLTYILKFLRWIFNKFATAALIIVLGFTACGLWLFLKDNVDFEQWRGEMVRSINGERAKVQAAMADVRERMDRISLQIASEQDRVKQADKVIAKRKDAESLWERLFGDREQQKVNQEQLQRVIALRQTITTQIETLQKEFTRATWERDGLEIALDKIDSKLRVVEKQQSKVLHYFEQTWNYELGRPPLSLPVKWWVVVVLALYFVGPTAGKTTMYFLLAPMISGGRPVRLKTSMDVLPEVSESHVIAEVALRPGELLWVKEKFLQASDEGLRRKTRYLLDWRIPFTCMATGLVELIEMSNASVTEKSEPRLTLSNQGDPHSELAIVTLPAGASIVLRPSFLAGVVVAGGERLRIWRRWQFFRWQAWVTLQFRFFEFAGPCRLIVAGSRGVRVERLIDREGNAIPARRTNQDATMGFTPNLDYRPTRAETFWSYYRGMNPLFDDLFAGSGIFLCQQVSAPGDAQKARKFWAGVWGGMMKVFGV